MVEYLEIGKIVNTHGIRGEVKVIPLTDNEQRFSELKAVLIDDGNKMGTFNIETVKYFKGFVIIKFKEIQDMSSAEKLKERYIKVDRKNAVKLPKDSFFVCDLIDCRVEDMDGNELGILINIIKTGSNDVYIVKDEIGKEICIPALKSVVKEISIEEKLIKVILPEGLI